MEKTDRLRPGDVVQIAPHIAMFGACLAMVYELKSFGAMIGVQIPGKEAGVAFLRVNWSDFEYVGRGAFVPIRPDGSGLDEEPADAAD